MFCKLTVINHRLRSRFLGFLSPFGPIVEEEPWPMTAVDRGSVPVRQLYGGEHFHGHQDAVGVIPWGAFVR